MSIRIMAKVWALNIPSGEKFVALALADNASDEGVCWPSIDTIAKKCSISRRSAIDQVAKLRGIGLIKTEPRGHKKSLRFDFDLAILDHMLRSACGAKSAPQSQDLTCNGCTAEGGSAVQNLHPEPSVEEPSDREPAGKPAGNLQKKVRARDQIVDQLVIESGGSIEEATDKEYKAAGIAAASIRRACPNVTVDDIRSRASVYRQKFSFAALTPMAIAGKWSQLAPPKSHGSAHATEFAHARRQEIAEQAVAPEVDPELAAEFFSHLNENAE